MTSKDSPCLSCTGCADPKNCENKNCSRWRTWFLRAWRDLRKPFLPYLKEGNDDQT